MKNEMDLGKQKNENAKRRRSSPIRSAIAGCRLVGAPDACGDLGGIALVYKWKTALLFYFHLCISVPSFTCTRRTRECSFHVICYLLASIKLLAIFY